MEYHDENHIIPYFESGEETQLVEKRLFNLEPVTLQNDFEDELLQLTHEIVELNERKVFLEGVAAYLGEHDASNSEVMLKEVQRRYEEKGIQLPKTVKLWFQNSDRAPSTESKYRRNLYDFCIALGMDYIETAEFFLKSFLTIPYNYKNRVDAIYFYCLKMGRDHDVVRRLLTEAELFEEENLDVDLTEHIGTDILSITDDEEFLHYLRGHCYDRKHQYQTAKDKLVEYIDKNKKIAPGKEYDELGGLGVKKIATLLAEILGYRYQELTPLQRRKMSHCGLPSFPRDADIDKLIQTNDISFDILRKSLILMKFYNFYRSLQRNNIQKSNRSFSMPEDKINENLYDFLDELNRELAECGFVQIYCRNPYDWIILFCANSPNPLYCLKDFINKRYLQDED